MPATVILRSRRAKPFFSRHPWIYAGAIAQVQGQPTDGDEVEVFSHGGHFIARGLYNSRSRVRVRLYCWEMNQPLDMAFWRHRLQQAIQLRREVLHLLGPGKACRLVFSEGDGLSGLTVDWYDGWVVMQFTGLGLALRREIFTTLLVELLQPRGILLRTEKSIAPLEGLELTEGVLWGDTPKEPVAIEEDGVVFLVDLLGGQKTGFYLDQRDNRRAVRRYAKGRRVLDAFCYTGGFALHAAHAGAIEVIGVDSSSSAIQLAQCNAQRNHLVQVRFVEAEVFRFLEEQARNRQRYDLIILDPPKFAHRQSAVENALKGYRRLLALSLLLLEPGGILVTCCCSGLITMDMLEELSNQAATKARRQVQILERHYQPPDHPIAVACRESSYLKCLIKRLCC
ncbi:MAG: class I SAM-dependent rRNA methyltransferase [Gemmatales bacterium]|nr:class I SAM-dependent rRNA methyltransferase [Gemmatales bacterium]MCS7160695.1 class I SAM-dependent rRNA methyltransferase [Gemmatales bacterium]MDW8175896.1 class I SAM-dependent rRNA methyltransferase [Gemmatales bacterium]MDW8223335.1 class I SAM-dependent rRNA methyltransferase [Gemmatales bacterium]